MTSCLFGVFQNRKGQSIPDGIQRITGPGSDNMTELKWEVRYI